MRIEFGSIVLIGRDAIMIAANNYGPKVANAVDRFDGIRSVTDDVAATKNRIVASEFRPLDTDLERFDIRVYVTQDEKAHGVL